MQTETRTEQLGPAARTARAMAETARVRVGRGSMDTKAGWMPCWALAAASILLTLKATAAAAPATVWAGMVSGRAVCALCHQRVGQAVAAAGGPPATAQEAGTAVLVVQAGVKEQTALIPAVWTPRCV